MYLIFIFHLCSLIGGGAPRDSVSSGLFTLDLEEALLNLLKEKTICPTRIPLDEVGRCWVTFSLIMDFPWISSSTRSFSISHLQNRNDSISLTDKEQASA